MHDRQCNTYASWLKSEALDRVRKLPLPEAPEQGDGGDPPARGHP